MLFQNTFWERSPQCIVEKHLVNVLQIILKICFSRKKIVHKARILPKHFLLFLEYTTIIN
jgi:hypothetical protein